MLVRIFLKTGLIALAGFCCQCESSSNLNPDKTDDSTGINPDTTVNFLPDTIQFDTVITRNSDSFLSASSRFGTTNIFSENELELKEGFYWEANDYIGRPVNLGYTFTAPAADTMKYRPFVLFVHEGAFIFGSRDNELGKASLLARKGYATASIDYRLGFNGGSQVNACGGNNKEVAQAMYRSVQDIYVALHYFMIHADDFGIDQGQVILAGSSAGAISISAFLYMHEAEFEKLDPGISKVLGKLNPYKNDGFKIKALLSSLGYAVVKTDYITLDNAKPTLFFQRSGDNTLAFTKGPLFFCPGYFYTEGAKNVSDRLKTLNIPYELNYEPLAGHQLSYSEEYITGRYALFLKRLWGKDLRQITNENYTIVEDNIMDN